MIMAGAKSEMPGSIDKAPRHDEATGWSSTAISYQRGEADPPHHHVEGQLLFATRGVMLVQTESDRWVIPPQRALWTDSTEDSFVASGNSQRGSTFNDGASHAE